MAHFAYFILAVCNADCSFSVIIVIHKSRSFVIFSNDRCVCVTFFLNYKYDNLVEHSEAQTKSFTKKEKRESIMGSKKTNEVEMVIMGETQRNLIRGHDFAEQLKYLESRHEELTGLMRKISALPKDELMDPIAQENVIKRMKLSLLDYLEAVSDIKIKVETMINAIN